MVTLEQKLSQFDKLVNDKIDKEIKNQLDEKNQEIQEYINKEQKIIEEVVRKNCKNYMDKINRQKMEKISSITQKEKKEYLKQSDVILRDLVSEVENKLRDFVLSKDYVPYISKVLYNTLNSEVYIKKDSNITIYLSLSQYNETKEVFLKILEEKKYINYEIKDIRDIGGFIIEAKDLNIRINKTLSQSIEKKRDDIGQYLHDYVSGGGVI